MVAGTAFAAGASGNVGGSADGGADPTPYFSGGFGASADGNRPIDAVNGPFYGLRVNSMDFTADAKRVAEFDYTLAGFLPGDADQHYQLVRTVWSGDVARDANCDEMLGLPFPADASVRFLGRMTTTRWIRDLGPNGKTPVGGFVGDFDVDVTRAGAETVVVPLLSLRVIGTQGLRPAMADPTLSTSGDTDRCSSPLHDEGFYQGVFARRTLFVLAKAAQASGDSFATYRQLANARIVGTFEGTLQLDPTADPRPYRFGALSKGTWNFDGVLGWRGRRTDVPAPTPGAAVTAGVSLSVTR
jgi:hypothetical protein